MARPLRLEVTGATYLISARSVHGDVLFGSLVSALSLALPSLVPNPSLLPDHVSHGRG